MRILIVRIGRAGDIVMITPALKALLGHYPDAHFTILTSKDGHRVLRDYDPRIKNIWVWDRSSVSSFIQKIKIRKQVKEGAFDKILCFETSKTIANVFKDSAAQFYWNSGTTEIIHSARQYLNLTEKACDTHFDDIPVNLPVSTDAEMLVDKELDTHGITSSDTLIMLHPSNSGYSKFAFRKRKTLKHRLWSAQSFSELGTLLDQLKTTSNIKILIDLLPEEKSLGDAIVSKSKATITLLTGKPNFERYKALLKRANLFVSPNTGPMHIAAAFNTQIVTMFSQWDPADCGPFTSSENYTVLRAEDMEEPDQGLSAIPASLVFEACKKHLDS